MAAVTNAELVDSLGRDIVAKLAPHELAVYRANLEAFFEEPAMAVEQASDKDEMLAFGPLSSGATFLTPVILSVVTEVVKHLVGVVKETTKTEGASLLSESIRDYFQKLRLKDEPAEQPEGVQLGLSEDELSLIHELAYEKGLQSKLTEDAARTLAESLIGSLVMAT